MWRAAALARVGARAAREWMGGGGGGALGGRPRGMATTLTSPDRPWGRQRVVVGISGGVDSAVAALLMQRAGHQVEGVYMRNWDEVDEHGGGCRAEEDLHDARKVCRHLGIPLHEVDFVRTYWTEVFEDFVAQCGQGLTPNPDLACNRHVKFSSLVGHVLGELGADALATGHYAQLSRDPARPWGEAPATLLRGRDRARDQTYFLASVRGEGLQRVHFPVGALAKEEVRSIAAEAGIPTADKRSSVGICFVGKRDFGSFISEYVEPMPGQFVSVDGESMGAHAGLACYTSGQRARLGGAKQAWYVVGKDVPRGRVVLAQGPRHPALFSTAAVVSEPHWVSGSPPPQLAEGVALGLAFKARYAQPVAPCSVYRPRAEGGGVTLSKFSVPLRPAGSDGEELLEVQFSGPTRAVTPGQPLVIYDGEACLGCAAIAHPGETLFEAGHLGLPPDDELLDPQALPQASSNQS